MIHLQKKVNKEISPKELSTVMKKNKLNLIDCRQAEELSISKIAEFVNIPMIEIPMRIAAFSKEDDLYILCRSGHRSAEVCNYLHHNGFKSVYNIVGGINAWSDEVDSSIQKY